QVKAQNALNESNQKAITLEQTKAKYVSQGYGKTDSTRLARLEVSGADVATLNSYKAAIEATTRATGALNPVVEKATTNHSNFLGQIKGIAIYAALSAAIYGVMTAMTSLAASTVKMADEYTSTQQRLKLYIKDAQTLGEVNTFLAKSAIQNNVGLRENAALYAKLAPAMQRIGANTAATNQVVDAFGKSMRIGGATATEAASATIQFAQAMASGKLAGDEFRSISEASPRFLQAIADGSGIAAEKLKEMSSAGALTTEVIARALVKEYHNLSKESESLGYTLEQGTNALKTGFMSLVGEFNEGAGITKYLGSLMADLGVSMIDGAKAAKENGEAVRVWFIRNADNIEMFGEALKMALSTFIAFKTTAMVLSGWTALTTAIVAARSATVGMTASMIAFNLAARATGASVAFLSNTLKFFGGWAGLILTAASAILTYVGVNKLMGDSTEETTKSLQEEGETIEDVVAKYKEMTKIQQEKALLDERKNVEAATKSYQDQKDALITAAARMKYFNEMTGSQSDVIDKLVLWYKDGKITLEQFSGAMKAQTSLTQDSKDKLITLASGVSEADKKAASASKVLEALGLATKGAGNEAEIAGSKYDKFLTDAQLLTDTNKLAARYMKAFNLDQSKAVDLAKQDLA
ncbi:MAG: tape measure protein, partial [Ignavibacteria bacterium]